ncbi:acyl carrier protein [Janthinobacterium sp. Mn2066]|uniref:acyl carrier protein n=1 Tax=Janthinobacterium sp. Mn2066 TaxID=3395264 RepID=UPI003BD7978E
MPHPETDTVGVAVHQLLRLSLGLGARPLTAQTPLLGSLPELDSMAVISVIAALEGQFGFEVADDEIHARHFATVGSLTDFVRARLASRLMT